MGLVNGSDYQRYERTGKKTNCQGWRLGVAHCGSPRAMFTLCLMRGEVVNLGNKEWGIPLCHWRCRCYIAQERHIPPKPAAIKKTIQWTFVEMWTVLMGVWGLENGEWKQTFLLAQLCISCPTTAEWDGWLIWTINIAVSNWCHITLFLSPEEKGSNQPVWVWSQSSELGTWGDQSGGLNFSGLVTDPAG